MKYFLLFIFCLFGKVNYNAQAAISLDSINLLVDVTIGDEIIYVHKIKKGETLYSLARYFRIAVQDLMQVNNIVNGQTIALHSEIKVPLDNRKIIKGVKPPSEIPVIPVKYLVKRRETLFKISHVYFPQAIQNLITRNNINSFSLDENQELIVGWWPISQLKKNISTPIILLKDNHPILKDEIALDSTFQMIESDTAHQFSVQSDSFNIETLNLKRTKGIAYWDKQGSDFENLFVMHNGAKENSYIKLTNPINGKELVAKVLMHIPNGIYTQDIDIVITPAVAKTLGALDSRFRIEMDYYE